MDFGRKTDVGRIRLENQDALAIFTNDDFVLLLLCDGMGGHYGGGIASSTTISVFDKSFKNLLQPSNQEVDIKTYTQWFKETINSVKKEMIRISDKDEAKLDMGTTVTGVLINKQQQYAIIFNIGDSRTFALTTEGELKQITVDHNYLNQLIKDGVPEIEAKKYRNNASLTSALGPDKKTIIEFFVINQKEFQKIHAFISTSDGAHDFIEKPTMEQILRKDEKAEELASEIVDYAIENLSTDNVTCGIVILDNKANWRI